MVILVSSGALNLSTSSTATNIGISRNVGNGLFNLCFSDLLSGQMQNGLSGRESGFPALENVQSARTPPAPEAPCVSADSSSANANSPRPSREPVREPAREPAREPQPASGQSNSPEGKRSVETQGASPTQQAETNELAESGEPIKASDLDETGKPAETGEKEKTAGNNITTEHHLQPQLTDVLISPDSAAMTGLPATIAALLNGVATDAAESIPDGEPAPESPAKGVTMPNMGLSRHTETPARAAAFTATQPDTGMEDNAECGSNDDQGTNPNPLATLMGRASRHSASTGSTAALSGTGNESSARTNVAAAFGMTANVANAPSTTPHEGGVARAAPAGATANAGEIPMLNPLRVSTQSGSTLPQFTIPAGTGQRAWAEEVGNRVMWMLGRAESRAELILTPPFLGKVEVSIHLNGDQSTAQFLASSQAAREALEQAMPRLRELLAQAGINLGEANVNTSAEDRAPGGENTRRADGHTSDVNELHDDNGGVADITPQNWSRLDSGLVNTFA